MAFRNLAAALVDQPRIGTDAGYFLSLHTGATPSLNNELDPARHTGYSRRYGPTFLGSPETEDAASWYCSLSPIPRIGRANDHVYRNEVTWGSVPAAQFNNRGATPWPDVLSCAIHVGPGARTPRNQTSYLIADLVLAQPWSLGAGQSGLPPDPLYRMAVTKPGSPLQPDAQQRFDSGGLVYDNGELHFFDEILHQVAHRTRTTPRNGGYGVTAMDWNLGFFKYSDLWNQYVLYIQSSLSSMARTLRFQARNSSITGIGATRPILVQGTGNTSMALVNRNAITVSATQAITRDTESWYWTLNTGAFASGGLVFYGKLSDAAPSLTTNGGTIAAGAIQIHLP